MGTRRVHWLFRFYFFSSVWGFFGILPQSVHAYLISPFFEGSGGKVQAEEQGPDTHSSVLNTLDSHDLSISDSQLERILSDPERRVEDAFRGNEGLNSHILFWLKIYCKYTMRQIVIYDGNNPDHILTVVDNSALYKLGLSPIEFEIKSKRAVSLTLKRYRMAISNLAGFPKKEFQSGSIEQALHQKFGTISSKAWRSLASKLRAQTGQKDRVVFAIRESEPFMAPMQNIFRQAGLSPALVYISLLESSFVIRARSKADALGVWQFLEASAKTLMVINPRIGLDERLSPIKASWAAAKMLRWNIKILGNTALGIISYNHGIGSLLRMQKKHGFMKLDKLLDPNNPKSPLGYASRNYYYEFLAMVYANAYSDLIYGIQPSRHNIQVEIVKTGTRTTFFDLASTYNVDFADLRRFNPDLFGITGYLPKGVRVVIPSASYSTTTVSL